ncbi:MAG TPA: hypothetical protein VFH64_13620, partial [Amnibacterium sp.]|nr:hypothetical protein [Amnibacterium sp.]
MVDVAEVGAAGAAGEPASVVAELEVSAQCRWDFVVFAADLDDGVGAGVDEDPVEARRLRGQPAGGVGVDGSVA